MIPARLGWNQWFQSSRLVIVNQGVRKQYAGWGDNEQWNWQKGKNTAIRVRKGGYCS